MALNFLKFSKKQTRQFSIPLRYYDPEQERKDNREERIRKELNIEKNTTNTGDYRSSIKGSFRANRGRRSVLEPKKNNRTVTVILIVFILVMLAYMFLR
jgi:hypothetical protein